MRIRIGWPDSSDSRSPVAPVVHSSIRWETYSRVMGDISARLAFCWLTLSAIRQLFVGLNVDSNSKPFETVLCVSDVLPGSWKVTFTPLTWVGVCTSVQLTRSFTIWGGPFHPAAARAAGVL